MSSFYQRFYKYIFSLYVSFFSIVFYFLDIYFDKHFFVNNIELHENIERIISILFIAIFSYIFYLLIQYVKTSKKVYYNLFKDVNVAIMVLQKKDNKNIIVGFNNMSETLWKIKENEILNKEFEDVFPGFKKEISLAINNTYCCNTPNSILNFNYIDNQYNKWVEIYISKLLTNEIIIVYADITKRKKIKDILEQSNKEKELLLKEVHHRVKNNLSVISGLFSLQLDNTKNKRVKTILKDTQNRIKSMSLIHEKIYKSEKLDSINVEDHLKSLINVIYETLKTPKLNIDFILNIEKNVILNINQAVPITLILNELISNSIEHAFINKKKGVIVIDFYRNNGNYVLTVKDDGIGLPKSIDIKDINNIKTLGFKLITSLAQQLQDDIEIKIDKGTKIKITFPIWQNNYE